MDWKIWLSDILNLTNFSNLKIAWDVIKKDFNWIVSELKPIKERLYELWYRNVSYFDIKLASAMIEKQDL